jgi:hypothetical protein
VRVRELLALRADTFVIGAEPSTPDEVPRGRPTDRPVA